VNSGDALVSAVPTLDPASRRRRVTLAGAPRSPIDPSPRVCRFFGRCPAGFPHCEREIPVLMPAAPKHAAACHLTAPTSAQSRAGARY